MKSKKPPVVSLTLNVKTQGLESILGAAYLMIDRAYVCLEGDRKTKITVRLSPKPGREAGGLAEAFRRELMAQKVRWAIAKNNLPIREHIAEQAILLASGVQPSQPAGPAAPAADQLTEEQRLEIEKLISEVEAEIKAMKEKKVADPKNIRASWEEKQEKRA